MNFITLASLPLLLLTQTYTLVITDKEGKTIRIPTEEISSMEFMDSEAPELPVLGTLSLKGGDATSTSVQALLSADENLTYCVGIVPRESYMTDAQLISYINTNSDAQRKELMGIGRDQEVIFSGLEPDSHYVIVAFDAKSTDTAIKYYVATSFSTTPGYEGKVFPAGVSSTSGFYDVDKKGNNSQYGSGWTTDNPFCWACSCAGVLAWWLDDYKSKTGEDYPLTPGVLPDKSACYSTPVMDVFVNACNPLPGSSSYLEWFMVGTEDNAFVNAEEYQFKESYPYWKGGFAGMTKEEFRENYLVTNASAHYEYETPDEYQYAFNTGCSIPKTADAAEAGRIFSEVILDALIQGPSYLGFGGNHALSCWGADYKVLADGTPLITHLYIGENDANPLNTQNALEHCVVKYEYDPKIGRQRYVAQMSTPIRGYDTITLMTHMRGWQPK